MIAHPRGWRDHCWRRGLIRLTPALTDDELAELLRRRLDRRDMERQLHHALDHLEAGTIFLPSRKRWRESRRAI